MRHERTIGSKGQGLWGMKGEQLPAYIQHVYNDMVEGGAPTGSTTYRRAVGIVENWAAGHDGKGNKVKPDTQAKAAAAIAEWNALRAKRHAMSAKGKIKEAILEASDGDAEDKSDKGSDESSEMPSVYCVKCRKKVKPTSEKKCPSCGTDLSKAVAAARKVQEAVLDAIGGGKAGPFDVAQAVREALAAKVQEANSGSAPLSNLPQRPGESLGAWGKRLQAADKQLAAQQSKSKKSRTRSGSSGPFNQMHPRGRGGQWVFKSGSSGKEVSSIQSKVGAKADGKFGSQTQQAVMTFQRKHGLKVDGLVGAQTVAAMRGRRNAATVKPGAMSGADRAWLLKQLVQGAGRRRHP